MNTIHHMNHSAKMQEPDSAPLERERNLNALYSELVEKVGATSAGQFGLSLTGLDYATKCEECERMLIYLAAWEADRTHDPRYPVGTYQPHDPRTAAERDLDQWLAESAATLESARP